jgi:hypothetical protein
MKMRKDVLLLCAGIHSITTTGCKRISGTTSNFYALDGFSILIMARINSIDVAIKDPFVRF